MKQAAIAFATVAVLFASARAEADVARHERVTIKPHKEGGEVVGVKIKLTLRPQGYGKALVGVVPMETAASDGWNQAKAGKLQHKIAEHTFKDQGPAAKEIVVKYKDVKGFEPGKKFQIVSAFTNGSSGSGYWHVFGVTGVPGATPQQYDVPKAPASKAKPKAEPKAKAKAKPKAKPKSTTKAKAKPKGSSVASNLRQASSSSRSSSSRTRSTTRSRAKAKPKPKSRARTTSRAR